MSGVASAAAPGAGASSGQGSQTSSRDGGGGAGGAGAQGAGAGDFDYQSAFRSQQHKLREADGRFQGLQREWEGAKPDLEIVRKLKGVFEPSKGEAQQESPVGKWEQQLDYYIEQAMEAKNRGQPIPLTANLAVELFQGKIDAHKREEALLRRIDQLEGGMKEQTDPRTAINQRAYADFDSHIKNGLERMFGTDSKTLDARRTQFNAIGKQVADAVRELQRIAPQKWEEIARSPERIRQIAHNALRNNMPPKAVQMIEQEQLRNTPMSQGELLQALRESKSIKDPVKRAEIATQIRQEYFSGMTNQSKRTG